MPEQLADERCGLKNIKHVAWAPGDPVGKQTIAIGPATIVGLAVEKGAEETGGVILGESEQLANGARTNYIYAGHWTGRGGWIGGPIHVESSVKIDAHKGHISVMYVDN